MNDYLINDNILSAAKLCTENKSRNPENRGYFLAVF